MAVTSTDLWSDADGLLLESCKPVPFFLVSDAETGNVTIDGVRSSGIDAGKVVYIAGMAGDYTPTVRAMYDSAIARARKVVGVSAAPAKAGDKIPVYTTGVVKVTLHDGANETVQAGKFVIGTYEGHVKSAPDPHATGVSYIDCIVGKAYQSAAEGDEFLVKLLL